ncbi:MAG TPA: 16S rRNA (guanine(966)-N(2))-methyltransferase RsmD [Candidatus Cloacimonadota bacterium]|mgnify:CR=1 FL=1|nr:16S rRNA (guanine(966)-N(2))-methyltransferase RsmD [Candidatus Cloacimonadota bacterium]
MRIITGKYKGQKILGVPGISTRPTTAFNREMIFSMYPYYEGYRVLDLFAGTGAFGLECLSRGAVWVDFVEFATPAIATLLENIQKMKCGASCHVHRRRVEAFLKLEQEPYDLIFLDPPYNKGLVNKCLELIFPSGLLKDDGLVIAEHSPREAIAEQWLAHQTDHKQGKITNFTIFEKSIEE